VGASLATVLASGPAPPVRLLFVGANEVADIALICLQAAPAALVGIIAVPSEPTEFLGRALSGWSEVAGRTLAGEPFDFAIVTTLVDREDIRQRLLRAGVESEHIV